MGEREIYAPESGGGWITSGIVPTSDDDEREKVKFKIDNASESDSE